MSTVMTLLLLVLGIALAAGLARRAASRKPGRPDSSSGGTWLWSGSDASASGSSHLSIQAAGDDAGFGGGSFGGAGASGGWGGDAGGGDAGGDGGGGGGD